MMHIAPYQALADYIKEEMRAQGIRGVRELAGKADISASTASALLRGAVPPRAETIKKVAAVLKIDELKMLQLAGHVRAVGDTDLDEHARYIAQRISALPDGLREQAIDAVSAVVDSFWNIQSSLEGKDVTPFQRAANTLRELKAADPELYEELMQETEARSK